MATAGQGGYQGDKGLVARLEKIEDGLRQQKERNARPKKIEPATPAGGIVDIARVESTATFPSFAGIRWPSGQASAAPHDTTYGAAVSMVDGAGVSWLSVTDSDISVTEDGFYQAWCYVSLQWTAFAEACGAGASIYLNGRDAPASPTFTVYEIAGGAGLLTAYVTNGPEWMTASDYWRVEADGHGATSADIQASQATWRITKYGSA